MEYPVDIKLENFTVKEEPIEYEKEILDLDVDICVKTEIIEDKDNIDEIPLSKYEYNGQLKVLNKSKSQFLSNKKSRVKLKHSGNETVHNCVDCKFSTLDLETLVKHKLIHLDEAPRSCPLCSYVTTSKIAFEEHVRSHSVNMKMMLCGTCNYKCDNLETLERHQTEHLIEVMYICKLCEFRNCDKEQVVKHTLNVHGLKCEFCEYRATTQISLKVHSRIHREKEFFNQMESLIDHTFKSIKHTRKVN